MINSRYPLSEAWLYFVVLLLIPVFAASSWAANPPQSYDDIKPFLPDTTILQNKVVYLDFWASWCTPCQKSFPWMQSLYDEYHNRGLEIIAVSLDKKKQAADKFLSDNEVSFPIVYDSTGTLAKKFNLEAMPSSFLYGRDGKLKSSNKGFKEDEAENLKFTIEDLLSEELVK